MRKLLLMPIACLFFIGACSTPQTPAATAEETALANAATTLTNVNQDVANFVTEVNGKVGISPAEAQRLIADDNTLNGVLNIAAPFIPYLAAVMPAINVAHADIQAIGAAMNGSAPTDGQAAQLVTSFQTLQSLIAQAKL